MMEWIESEGGIAAIEQRNDAKASLLYAAIDGSNGFYHCPVEPESRSKMNVVFRVGKAGGDEAIEKRFAREATSAQMAGTAGHRSVGGIRVSLYNAVTIEAVTALVDFMHEFQQKHG